MTSKEVFVTISKLFRIRPVIAWSLTSFVLVIASGMYDGMSPDWILALLSLIIVVLLQGIVSHAVNDIVDEKIDKMANIKETGRFKVLIHGKSNKMELFTLICIALAIVWAIVWYIFFIRGYVIMLLAFAGIFYIYAYNYKPLKLNYRPFAEYTVVIPVILLISFGFNMGSSP